MVSLLMGNFEPWGNTYLLPSLFKDVVERDLNELISLVDIILAFNWIIDDFDLTLYFCCFEF